MKIIVGITGATGAIFGVRMLEWLKKAGAETHLVISPWAGATIQHETGYTIKDLEKLASFTYSHKDQAARISSGSFQTDGMIVAPCSMKTLAGIRTGLADNLLTRSADVMLKERKKLILLTRETPLNQIHLENMLELSRMGVMILPPMPAFYNHPQNLMDMVDHIVFRTLDQFGIHLSEAKRWEGMKQAK
ncbi:non-oxidative hydroxyarylic acid decarboxylases subunit B [Bacillus swezeyi]|uniref:Probable UbiX-like flavin prenyltransferase n=1 Tax=Bacillus swezeyi TaxID=1925020 RepID=A0A1R1S3I7_9BACI|nr:non-oxidative hydroxyarylic acid decarboxylases subunit B [Bacillus swezeyi]MEC1260106.1 non-oxidative hydroxyarylic acid decarboxylases subunit B [Bacillus swezeyi]MED1738782.1 non-oxidative hydroxyarylic acid decarboxylases subunit B [Bacillus swezeyi]MED2927023.1 non-oxidative hydroxyarylic acid decarboxylases subunit B [Bacillus swezeyi]MED2942636.1 non-oxidative hydroxyarylic acid decarboxylases subunit B [Bacillus swezeyi]MED2964873.1 non-oxidative hydroxyarylic acid decarboxylases su